MDHLMALLTKIITMMGGPRTLSRTNPNIFHIYTLYTPILYTFFYFLRLSSYYPPFIIPSFYKKKSNNKSKLVKRKTIFRGTIFIPRWSLTIPKIHKIAKYMGKLSITVHFPSKSLSKISKHVQLCPNMSITNQFPSGIDQATVYTSQ